jgi:uncharacterized protein YjbI with pentapeptide repeats
MTIRPIFARIPRLAGAALALLLATAPAAMADCWHPARSYVDWSGCDKSNAHLVNLEFYEANLSGVNLRNAILRGADLTGANLTNADLTGADLREVNLKFADLSGAQWTDGRVCAQGSIGACN